MGLLMFLEKFSLEEEIGIFFGSRRKGSSLFWGFNFKILVDFWVIWIWIRKKIKCGKFNIKTLTGVIFG